MHRREVRAQRSPLALSPACYARGSSCPQCGREGRTVAALVYTCNFVLHRRPQCGQQLLPSTRLGFVRASKHDFKTETGKTQTPGGVLNSVTVHETGVAPINASEEWLFVVNNGG
jgi:hypothetical protein